MDLISYLEKNGKQETWEELGKKFNISGEAARKRWKKHKKSKLTLKSKWQVQTKDGVKWLESYTNKQTLDYEKVIGLVKQLPKPTIQAPQPSLDKLLCVVNIYDLHLDKINYKGARDTKTSFMKNRAWFENIAKEMIAELQRINPEMICLPLGNDLYHTNGMNNQTKRGTILEYYLDPHDAYAEVTNLILWFVEELAKISHLYIPMIKGNHDEDKIFLLGYWLDHIYKDTHVKVDFTMDQRKYMKFGENLIGFAHGDKEKNKIHHLPLLMATEQAYYWGQTKHRKFFCGDLHHTQTFKFLAEKDYPGVEVCFLRGLSGTDQWHSDNGYIGVPKTGYIHTFDSKRGELRVDKFNL